MGDRRVRAAILIALLLALTSIGAAAALGATGSSARRQDAVEESAELEGPAAPQDPEGVEIESARTETSDTFRLPDGEREVRLYEAPVNEKTAPGKWEPIEEALEPGPGASLVSDAGSVEVKLPEKLGEASVRLSVGNAWVASKLLGTNSEPAEVEGTTAAYELNGSDASVELSRLPNGVKEAIVLPGPSSPSDYRFELTASTGLAPKQAEDGSIVFYDGAGKEVAHLPAPFMSDAAGGIEGTSDAVHYGLEPHGTGHWLLSVEASREWLEAPDRAWPVTIDPSFLTAEAGAARDCVIWSATTAETWNHCASDGYPTVNADALDHEGMQDEYAHSVLFFSFLGLVSPTAEVQSANLNLYASTTAASTNGLELRRAEAPWTNYVSWKYSGYPNCLTCSPWTIPGGTNWSTEPTVGQMTTASRGGSGPGWWTVPVDRAMVQEWVSGGESKNLGMVLEQLGEREHACTPTCVYRHAAFESSADSVVAQRPYVSLTYIPRAPITNKLSSPTEGTRTARRLKLAAEWKGAGIQGVTFQYREGKTGPFQTIPPELVQTAEGKAVSWPIPTNGFEQRKTEPVYFDAAHVTPNLRKAGGIVEVRALFTGSSELTEASAPVQTVVNRSSGGSKDASASVGPGSVDLLTGNFTTSASDVSIPTYNAGLNFGRSYSSRRALPGATKAEAEAQEAKENSSVLGAGWTPGFSLEEEGGSAWKNLRIVEEKGSEEGENEEGEIERFEWNYSYAVLTTQEGAQLAFEQKINEKLEKTYSAPPEVTGWTLVAEEGGLVLSDPSGTRTTFTDVGGTGEYVPTKVSQSGGSAATTARVEYELESGKKRITMITAPVAPGVSCTTSEQAKNNPGCRALLFKYEPATTWKAPPEYGQRLANIWYYTPGLEGLSLVASYQYDSKGRLIAEWDNRLRPSLRTTYSYGSNGALQTITPPGQEPWTLEYKSVDEEEGVGRLTAVKRPSLLASPTTAQTSIAYGVPVSTAPYDLSGATVRKWGQKDAPADATAIFPPDQVPTSSPPSTYSHATVHYTDAEGQEVNTVAPSPTGSGEAISTTEADEYGNVVRELTPKNRALAMAESTEAKRLERAEQLDTRRYFGEKGTQLEEEFGPLHTVKLESGSAASARLKRVLQYDQGMPAGTKPDPHLPTRETLGALVAGVLKDEKVTETQYDWTLRKPTKLITVMGSEKPNIERVTVYNHETGLVEKLSQPSDVKGTGAGTTRFIYNGSGSGTGCENAVYWGFLCKVEPAAQPSEAEAPSQPKLTVKKFLAYNEMAEPTETTESPAGEATNVRRVLTTYDGIGRPTSTKVEGGGAAIPKTETVFSQSTGLPERQRFACEGECASGTPKYVGAFGGSGSGNGQLNAPRGIALDGRGHVWVVDRENSRIEEFSESGEFLFKFGSVGSGNGQLSKPLGIAIDSKGNIWVTDSGNFRVEEFNSKGEFLQKFGTKATGASQVLEFVSPDGIAIAPGGKLWVTDNQSPRVSEFRQSVSSESERYVRSTNEHLYANSEPEGIAVDAEGDVFVAGEEPASLVYKFNSEGILLRTIGSVGTGEGQLSKPSGVAVAPSGDILVSDYSNNRVQEFNSGGVFLRAFGSGTGAESFSEPDGIGISAGSAAFIVDKNRNQIKKWNIDAGFRSQAIATTYDALGRPVEYEDADGNVATTTYDIDGRPVVSSDGKGSETFTYAEASGALTKLIDSGAGTFTAAYDADGNLTERALPNGLTARTTYNETDEPTKLAYTKTTSCGENCTWYEESLERSIYGQIRNETNTLAHDEYAYDRAGRLEEAKETPTGGNCVTRKYAYDLDSNRLSKTTREPGLGTCATSGGSVQSYKYDAGDRLQASGLTYDAWGRITALPAELAGGKALTTSYYSTDMVASQTQNGVTNSYNLDPTGRQRSRLQGGGGLEGTEIFHYDGASDAPAWTERGSTWSRNVSGIGGELAATQSSSSGVTLEVTNLHGDAVATASPTATATKLLASYRFDEFGNPVAGSAGRFGWLGGKSRRTELSSGVIQMGRRSYVPSIGRFLTPDPVRGGSANTYDYASQDPINAFDLGGEKFCVGVGHGHEICGSQARDLQRETRRARKTGKVSIQFQTRRGAENFRHYLESGSRMSQNWLFQAENLRASELYALEQKANRIAKGEVTVSGGDDCKSLGTGFGLGSVAIGVGAAPETLGASLVIGLIGFGTSEVISRVC